MLEDLDTLVSSLGLPPEVSDRFEIFEALGAGGMGVALKARDRRLDRFVVIKVIRDTDQEAAIRLSREAEILAGLEHPHVVRVHDTGRGAGGPFLVMEFLEGASLESRLPCDGETILRGVAQGLDAIHAAGIVHRDVKPANIMVTAADRVVLIDFGLALDAQRARLTATGQLVGSVAFMAPEALAGTNTGPEADWYGLGATIFWIYEGRAPFPTASLMVAGSGDFVLPVPSFDKTPLRLRTALTGLLRGDLVQRLSGTTELEKALSGPPLKPSHSRSSRRRAAVRAAPEAKPPPAALRPRASLALLFLAAFFAAVFWSSHPLSATTPSSPPGPSPAPDLPADLEVFRRAARVLGENLKSENLVEANEHVVKTMLDPRTPLRWVRFLASYRDICEAHPPMPGAPLDAYIERELGPRAALFIHAAQRAFVRTLNVLVTQIDDPLVVEGLTRQELANKLENAWQDIRGLTKRALADFPGEGWGPRRALFLVLLREDRPEDCESPLCFVLPSSNPPPDLCATPRSPSDSTAAWLRSQAARDAPALRALVAATRLIDDTTSTVTCELLPPASTDSLDGLAGIIRDTPREATGAARGHLQLYLRFGPSLELTYAATGKLKPGTRRARIQALLGADESSHSSPKSKAKIPRP